jgi:hypothetical protein
MLALRVIALLVVLTVGASVVTFLVTRDRRWLRFAFQVFKYGVFIALMIVGLMALERVFVVVV